jgi:hypothetical protein
MAVIAECAPKVTRVTVRMAGVGSTVTVSILHLVSMQDGLDVGWTAIGLWLNILNILLP